ncbi:MAG: CRISPR-associated endonuclease Cas1, partial [Saprospiraceae bacterium]|nr:CRISPR-associated endonuclease Cas1 [Saprospiraceae bacterium]
LLTRGTGMTTDAALLAVENDIPVLLIDAQTHRPLAQLSSGRPATIAAVRKNQVLFARSAAGLSWAAEQIAEKVARQRQLLKHWVEYPAAPEDFSTDVAIADRVLAAMQRELSRPISNDDDLDAAIARLRGQEGTASRVYFQQIARLLDGAFAGFSADSAEDFVFEGRQKRPAYDPFNALLNYLYGMLYTAVHLALLKAGLDPYLGVLHADRFGAAPTLVFDAIEPYRPWADTVALRLVLNGLIGPEAFEQRADPVEGLWLSTAGKDVVIGQMLQYLEESTPFDGRQVRRKAQIDLEAQFLKKKIGME